MTNAEHEGSMFAIAEVEEFGDPYVGPFRDEAAAREG